jgi:archaellum biogenesis protein FlaJ (TadC family)
MTVLEHYQEARKHGYYSLVLLIEYLVHERKVISMGDSEEKLTHYLKEEYRTYMNKYLTEYERTRKDAV